MDKGIGGRFQLGTKARRLGAGLSAPGAGVKPGASERATGAKVKLPDPSTEGGGPLWDAMRKRRSVRRYLEQPVLLAELSQLFWAMQGITARKDGFAFRCAPSAGALYPLETYLVANRVDDLLPGIYHYEVGAHRLTGLKSEPSGRMIAEAGLGQAHLENAAAVFMWSAVVERIRRKYRERAYRYIYVEAGHVAQNLALAAVSLGLATCPVGAYYDEEVDALLGLDGAEETVIYMMTVGRPEPGEL